MEISRFLCHKLRILCVRKSEIWHASVRFIPQTALVLCGPFTAIQNFSSINFRQKLMLHYPILKYIESCSVMCFKFVRESLKANFSRCNLINIRKGANGAIVWMFRNLCIYVNPWSEDAELPKTHSHTNLTFLGRRNYLEKLKFDWHWIQISQFMLRSLVYISENMYKKLGWPRKEVIPCWR